MTTIRFIGDVHGHFARYETILKNSPYPTIQVGDMGIGFKKWPHGEFSANPPYDKMVSGNHKFIRGNHDNPSACKQHSQWIEDGRWIRDGNTTIMFIGGALSIDKAYRVDGFSYWSDEELPSERLMALVDLYEVVKPNIMVTHECPDTIAEMVVNEGRATSIKLDPRFASRTRQAFQSMFELYQPKLWIAGHWHVPFDKIVNGTRFVCLPELATMDVNIKDLES